MKKFFTVIVVIAMLFLCVLPAFAAGKAQCCDFSSISVRLSPKKAIAANLINYFYSENGSIFSRTTTIYIIIVATIIIAVSIVIMIILNKKKSDEDK